MSRVTTGSTALSATSTGYARAAGSFLADGFAVGMLVSGAGFTTPGNNAPKVLTAVGALTMSAPGCSAEGPLTATLNGDFRRFQTRDLSEPAYAVRDLSAAKYRVTP